MGYYRPKWNLNWRTIHKTEEQSHILLHRTKIQKRIWSRHHNQKICVYLIFIYSVYNVFSISSQEKIQCIHMKNQTYDLIFVFTHGNMYTCINLINRRGPGGSVVQCSARDLKVARFFNHLFILINRSTTQAKDLACRQEKYQQGNLPFTISPERIVHTKLWVKVMRAVVESVSGAGASGSLWMELVEEGIRQAFPRVWPRAVDTSTTVDGSSSHALPPAGAAWNWSRWVQQVNKGLLGAS